MWLENAGNEAHTCLRVTDSHETWDGAPSEAVMWAVKMMLSFKCQVNCKCVPLVI